jgi:hypothetical protein
VTALSLALALWGLLAFAGWWMWLRAQKPEAHPLEAKVTRLYDLQRRLEDECAVTEERRRKLSKRVGDLEFRQLGKRMTPPEDEA